MSNGTLDLSVLDGKDLATTVEASKGIAEIQASLLIAKSFPRNEISCINKIMVTCQRQKLAEKAIYQYARGGSSIEGASIRLAEVLATCWGNIDYGYKVLESNKEYSKVEAYAWDKETNAKRSTTFEASHYRNTKKGRFLLTDDRDIYEIVANLSARRVRACILSILPYDVQETAMDECKKTLVSKADITDQTRKNMVDAFEKLGVNKKIIEKRIQRKLEAIEPSQFLQLKNIHNSIRDGIAQIDDFFELDTIETNTVDFTKKQTAPETTQEPYTPPSMVKCPNTDEEQLSTVCDKCASKTQCPESPHFVDINF